MPALDKLISEDISVYETIKLTVYTSGFYKATSNKEKNEMLENWEEPSHTSFLDLLKGFFMYFSGLTFTSIFFTFCAGIVLKFFSLFALDRYILSFGVIISMWITSTFLL